MPKMIMICHRVKNCIQNMIKAGKVAELKIYPSFGKSTEEGNSFPYKGVSIWFDDVYSFINKYCSSKKENN